MSPKKKNTKRPPKSKENNVEDEETDTVESDVESAEEMPDNGKDDESDTVESDVESEEEMPDNGEDEESATVESDIVEEMPEPRKKIYIRQRTTKQNGSKSKMERCRLVYKSVIAFLFVAVIVTLAVLATGDRPLAVAINQAMDSSGELLSEWFETPSNDTDAMGDKIEPETTTPFMTTESWTITTPTPPTKKPSAQVVTPTATLTDANFTYEFFKQPWTLETAISICQRRNGHLIYFDNEAEADQIRDWIRFNVTDKLPYWKAGNYWMGGMSVGSNPLWANYTWSWRGGAVSTGYQNFCPNHTNGIVQEYWDAHPDQHNLSFVMDFKRIHHLDPSMGCWKLMFPMVEELREEHKDLAGLPFICKIQTVAV